MRWDQAKKEQLRELWNRDDLSATEIGHRMGISRGAVLGASIRLNLHFRRGRAITLDTQHEAALEGRTLFPGRVRNDYRGLLKPGSYQRKLGRIVKKGHWKGFPIYSLTLEERKTCPKSCKVWNACYGNGMQYAARYRHGEELEAALFKELEILQGNHPAGFVIRLHILGDFYSVRYVEFWKEALWEFPALHVFGYSAWQPGTPIGDAIISARKRWMRFAVRTSGAKSGPRTLVVSSINRAPEGAIVCPAQRNLTASCATCALCWATKKPIAFLKH